MFNPAVVLYVLTGICAAFGAVHLLSGATPSIQFALPDASTPTDPTRNANRTDEYALLLAHYGQPSSVTVTQAGNVALRTASYDGAHLDISFVPVGCVDAYAYYEAHKDDLAPQRTPKRHKGASHARGPDSHPCVPPADNASTVVAYKDTASSSSIDSLTAERYLSGMGLKSSALPTVNTIEPAPTTKQGVTSAPTLSSVKYNEQTLKSEQGRLSDSEAAGHKKEVTGIECLGGALLFLVPAAFVHRKNREKRTTQLVYDLSESAKAQQSDLDGALEQLTASRAIWRVDSQAAISDWKRNAGAAYNVKREQISVRRAVPPRVESNVVPVCFDLGKLRMFFFPDQVLYWQRGTFASIEYKDLTFGAGSTRFIEDQVQTADSRQVGSTWHYVRKDGGPDRRFNNNRQLPIMLYGVVTAVSSGGLNLLLHTSNSTAAESFANSFRVFQGTRDHRLFGEPGQTEHTEWTESKRQATSSAPANIQRAMEVLGLTSNATLEEVAAAYRHMAQMYHPDKVAGLGPELQKLAEDRMKEINAAHSSLKKHFEGA